MWLQLFILFLAIVSIPLFKKHCAVKRNGTNDIRRYTQFICFLLIIQSGLRHVAVGSDTFAYYQIFEGVKNSTWDDLYTNLVLFIKYGFGKDPGYAIFVKTIQLIFPEYRFFLFGVAILFFTSFYRLTIIYAKKYSDVLLSLVIYFAIYYSFFSITGLRQTIATSVALLALPYIAKRQFFRFAIAVLLVSFIHKSVLLILPLYYIANIKKTRLLYICSLIIFPISITFARQIAFFLASVSGGEDYMSYALSTYETSGAITFSVLLVVTAICSLFAISTRQCQELLADVKYRILFNSVPIALTLVPLTFVDPTLQRVGQYYSIFIIWLLPIILIAIDKSKVVWTIFFAIILFTIISHDSQYAFMWQEMQLGANYFGEQVHEII
jgi:transmembrane protein EpsG